MIHTLARRTRLYRRLAVAVGYRQPVYRTTSKALGVIMNLEFKDMQSARKGAR